MIKYFLCLIFIIISTYNNIFSQNIHSRNTCPVTIFYGLNESHSNDWAQYANNGLIGMTYFVKDTSQSDFYGNLVYKTIRPDNSENEEIVASGNHLEVAVLLFDDASNPHIFLACSDTVDQVIIHYYKNCGNQWISDTIMHFLNEGGKYIYELSSYKGTNNSFHLIILKTRSNPDSDDYYYAFRNSHLYYMTNSTGTWLKELIANYDMIWTLDEYSKALNRQDFVVDSNNKVHLVFGEQINGMSNYSPSRLRYATNINGSWEIETAINYISGTRDDAGWYPSICLDNTETPCISCSHISRVSSGSAAYSNLIFAKKSIPGIWDIETVATTDDGYYGTDGHNYTGALTNLKFNSNNEPCIIFSDIASSHAPMNYLNLGNIRYAVKSNNVWTINTIFRQELPNGFFNATEMYGMCLLKSNYSDDISVVGQQLNVRSNIDYNTEIIHIINNINTNCKNPFIQQSGFKINPNPCFSESTITFFLDHESFVKLIIYNTNGEIIETINYRFFKQGVHSINLNTSKYACGVYYIKLCIENKSFINKLIKIL